jgi:hypothetical protein
VFADLIGKGGHMRTVPIPNWVGSAIQTWLTAADVASGPMFRAINKAGRIAECVQSESDLVDCHVRLPRLRLGGCCSP